MLAAWQVGRNAPYLVVPSGCIRARRPDGDTVSSPSKAHRGSTTSTPGTEAGLTWRNGVTAPVLIRTFYGPHARRRRVGFTLSDAWTLHTFAGDLKAHDQDRPVVVVKAAQPVVEVLSTRSPIRASAVQREEIRRTFERARTEAQPLGLDPDG